MGLQLSSSKRGSFAVHFFLGPLEIPNLYIVTIDLFQTARWECGHLRSLACCLPYSTYTYGVRRTFAQVLNRQQRKRIPNNLLRTFTFTWRLASPSSSASAPMETASIAMATPRPAGRFGKIGAIAGAPLVISRFSTKYQRIHINASGLF